ncbi:MAG TPA: hypothetical protein DCQ79_03325 [Rhizobiales bacterium]|nr:hypothetical protein [Hyphomicrobiales bacterium]
MPGVASVGTAAAAPFSFQPPIQSRSAPSSSRRLLAAVAVGLPMHPLLAVAAAVVTVLAIIMCRAPITPIGRNLVSARAIPVPQLLLAPRLLVRFLRAPLLQLIVSVGEEPAPPAMS